MRTEERKSNQTKHAHWHSVLHIVQFFQIMHFDNIPDISVQSFNK